MNAQRTETIPAIYEMWESGAEEQESRIDSICQWMEEVSQLGIPHFGETATRLRPMRDQLLRQFQWESELIRQIAEFYPLPSPEVAAVRRQARRSHRHLRTRLEDLISRLEELDPPFDSWQEAIEELHRFACVLEEHNHCERESLQMLMPFEVEQELLAQA